MKPINSRYSKERRSVEERAEDNAVFILHYSGVHSLGASWILGLDQDRDDYSLLNGLPY